MTVFPSYIVKDNTGEARFYDGLDFIHLLVRLGNASLKGKRFKSWCQLNGITLKDKVANSDIVIKYLTINEGWVFEEI